MTPLCHMKWTFPLISEICLGTFHSLRKPPSCCSPLPRHFLMSSDLVQFVLQSRVKNKQNQPTQNSSLGNSSKEHLADGC